MHQDLAAVAAEEAVVLVVVVVLEAEVDPSAVELDSVTKEQATSTPLQENQ